MGNLEYFTGTSLVSQTVKRLYTMWETRVRSLGQEDRLEKEMTIHSNTVAWKIISLPENKIPFCPFLFLKFIFLIGQKLLYKTAILQSESDIIIQISPSS